MRIALVTGGMPFGGTTTFMLFLCSGLKKLGVPVEIFSFAAAHPLETEFSNLHVKVHRVNDNRLIFEDRLSTLYQELRRFNPTAVFSVLASESFEILRYLPAPVLRVGMLHDHIDSVYSLIRNYRQWMDHVAVVSQPIADYVAREFPSLPCTYLQHGVIFYDEQMRRAPNPSQPLKILFFGRLQQSQKQVRIFPQIYAAMKRQDFPFRWTIHGEGPEKDFLVEHLREAVECGDVRFSETVQHDKLPELISAHDIYLLASAHEGGPLSLIEAMGRGLVPICGDIPCLIQEMIGPQNGFRVRRDQPNEYAIAIHELHRDRTRLERMSSVARGTAFSGYDDVAMAERYLKFITRHHSEKSVNWERSIRVQPIVGLAGWTKHPALKPLRRLRKRFRQI